MHCSTDYPAHHRGEARKKGYMPSKLLGPLITSKIWLKLLLRFFLNQNLSGDLQGLSKALDENTNSVRLEPNRLQEVRLLSVEEQGRRRVYSVNTARPLTTELSNMLRKVIGIDVVVDCVVSRIGDTLEQVWITGATAMGINSEELEVPFVGESVDTDYLSELIGKVETLIEKTSAWQASSSDSEIDPETSLFVWQKANE